MKSFAKLYQSDDVGQVLVMLRLTGEDQPEIHFYFDPNVEGLGVAATHVGFSDDDDGAVRAEKAFDLITEAAAIGVAKAAIDQIRQGFGEEVE